MTGVILGGTRDVRTRGERQRRETRGPRSLPGSLRQVCSGSRAPLASEGGFVCVAARGLGGAESPWGEGGQPAGAGRRLSAVPVAEGAHWFPAQHEQVRTSL